MGAKSSHRTIAGEPPVWAIDRWSTLKPATSADTAAPPHESPMDDAMDELANAVAFPDSPTVGGMLFGSLMDGD